jgi:hypothetical protein
MTSPVFAIGNKIVLGGNCAVEITSVTDNTAIPLTPPFLFTLGITFLTGTTASSGSQVYDTWSGFSNAERTAKTAAFQGLMDSLIADLELALNTRITRLDTQTSEINANGDDSFTNKSTVLNEISTSKSFIQGYLTTTDISDTGVGSLNTEKGVRQPQVTARISAIVGAYTAPVHLYDKRYEFAKGRGSTSIGTLRSLSNSTAAKNTMLFLSASATQEASLLNSVL